MQISLVTQGLWTRVIRKPFTTVPDSWPSGNKESLAIFVPSHPLLVLIQMSDLPFQGQLSNFHGNVFFSCHLFNRGTPHKMSHCTVWLCCYILMSSRPGLQTYQGKMIGLYIQFFYFCISNFRIHFTFGTEHNANIHFYLYNKISSAVYNNVIPLHDIVGLFFNYNFILINAISTLT